MLRKILYIIIGVLLLSFSGRYTWELGWDNLIVPITLQSITLISLSQLFPKRLGIYSTFIWLLLATMGFPLLAMGVGGIEWVALKSSGYLFGFFIASIFLNRTGIEERNEHTFKKVLIEQFFGTCIILFFGYLKLGFHIGLDNAFQFGVVPFIFGGIIKIFLGAIFVKYVFLKYFQKTCI